MSRKLRSLSSLVLVVTAPKAWLLFDETLTLIQIAGMLVCPVGVLIVTRGKK